MELLIAKFPNNKQYCRVGPQLYFISRQKSMSAKVMCVVDLSFAWERIIIFMKQMLNYL